MSTWQSVGALGSAIQNNDATQKYGLGQCIAARDMDPVSDYGDGEFIYAKGLASTAVGECVVIDAADWSTKLAVANDVGRIGFAMAATLAGEFGWYQVRGRAVSLSLAANADNAAQYLTATPGSIDDAVVAGDRIHRVESVSAVDTPSTGLIELDIDFPHTDNVAD